MSSDRYQFHQESPVFPRDEAMGREEQYRQLTGVGLSDGRLYTTPVAPQWRGDGYARSRVWQYANTSAYQQSGGDTASHQGVPPQNTAAAAGLAPVHPTYAADCDAGSTWTADITSRQQTHAPLPSVPIGPHYSHYQTSGPGNVNTGTHVVYGAHPSWNAVNTAKWGAPPSYPPGFSQPPRSYPNGHPSIDTSGGDAPANDRPWCAEQGEGDDHGNR